jgi:hypothetical protein
MFSLTRDVEGRPVRVIIDALPPLLEPVHPFIHSSTLHGRLTIHHFQHLKNFLAVFAEFYEKIDVGSLLG